MQHLRNLEPIHAAQIWTVIGAFDGVHLGHQHLIQTMTRSAKPAGIQTAVITFFPHPAVVLRNIDAPFYLTTPEEKAAVFEQMGIDFTITLPFDKHLAGKSPLKFIQAVTANFPIRKFWIGPDFTFGNKRSGNAATLAELGKEFAFQAEVVDLALQDHEKISSSSIRQWILSGEIELAEKALGRPYSVSGIIEKGDQRGRTIGFPTANLAVWEKKILPPAGVYATFAVLEGHAYPSVTNVGFRPTFIHKQIKPSVETYIHDFDSNIYDRPLQLFFIRRIRPEKKFENISAIIDQIRQDVQTSEEILRHAEAKTSLFIGPPEVTP